VVKHGPIYSYTEGRTLSGDGTELKTLAAWGITEINLAYDDGTGFGRVGNGVALFYGGTLGREV